MAEPQRVQRKRTKGWRMPEDTICVTRPGRWGNYSGDALKPTGAKAAYRRDILKGTAGRTRQLSADDAKRELRGKNLACYCAIGDPCHADVLLEIANAP